MPGKLFHLTPGTNATAVAVHRALMRDPSDSHPSICTLYRTDVRGATSTGHVENFIFLDWNGRPLATQGNRLACEKQLARLMLLDFASLEQVVREACRRGSPTTSPIDEFPRNARQSGRTP